MREILTVLINLTERDLEAIKGIIEMDFGTTKVKSLTHEVAKDFKVSHIPASCQKILNDIDDLADKYGVEYYQGLKVIIHHTDVIVVTYLVKELRKRSIRVFTKDLREFLY